MSLEERRQENRHKKALFRTSLKHVATSFDDSSAGHKGVEDPGFCEASL